MLIQPASACPSIRACTTKAISEAAPMLAIASQSSVASRSAYEREAGEDVEPEARQSPVIAVGFPRMAAFVVQLEAGDPASGLTRQGWYGIGRILCWSPVLRCVS